MATNLIWKRPDGFHGATPSDFNVVNIGGHSNLWVHKRDKDTFPFRISGGWEEEAQTKKLNNLINLLNDDSLIWENHVDDLFSHSMQESPAAFIKDLQSWIDGLKAVVKGGNWEKEIIDQVLDAVKTKVQSAANKLTDKP